MSSTIKIRSLGVQWEYSWTDELGFHQYYCEKLSEKVENFTGFTKKKIDQQYIYSWSDSIGYHEYIIEI